MSNMSYCRFQNTSKDLEPCAESLEEQINDSSVSPLSKEEFEAMVSLVSTCCDIVSLISDYTDYSPDDLVQLTHGTLRGILGSLNKR